MIDTVEPKCTPEETTLRDRVNTLEIAWKVQLNMYVESVRDLRSGIARAREFIDTIDGERGGD